MCNHHENCFDIFIQNYFYSEEIIAEVFKNYFFVDFLTFHQLYSILLFSHV